MPIFIPDKTVCGKEKARKLGLTAERFLFDEMSKNAKESIENVKKKDRTQIKLQSWSKNNLYCSNATKQLFNCPDQIQRQNASALSVEDFVQKYQKQNLPVIIKGCTQSWNAKTWNFQYFYDRYKQTKFKIAEDDDGYKLRVPFKYYLQYLVYNRDDSPLYLFESSLEDKEQLKEVISNYQVPKYFRDDLFHILGEKKRPPYRWLLMGPQRSGTTVHIDPLGTSAWNTSLVGHKRWVLFKQGLPKSIVKGKTYRNKNYDDQSINYFTEILPKIRANEDNEQIKLIEFIQYPGETVFIPGGWWHAVLNLNDTIAVTQNVMTHQNFDKVWRAVRVQRRKMAIRFLQKLQSYDELLYQRAIKLNKDDNYQMGSKYERQSVSMSFTESQSSSSSSSSNSASSISQKRNSLNKVKKIIGIQNKKAGSIRSRSYSRSRDKNKRAVHSYSEQKHSLENVSN